METNERWLTFQQINLKRRAIRDFDGLPINDHTIENALREALLAPSSANIQPYRFLWIKNAGLKEKVAAACNNQRAAKSATTLIVVVTDLNIVRASLESFTKALQEDPTISDKTRTYYLNQTRKLRTTLGWLALPLWSPLKALASAFLPVLDILPVGSSGISNWAARNSIYAVQNLLLALAAQGIDTCPMEGFNAVKVASLLKLKRTMCIPVIIAVGRRTADAVIDQQWRRPLEQVVTVY